MRGTGVSGEGECESRWGCEINGERACVESRKAAVAGDIDLPHLDGVGCVGAFWNSEAGACAGGPCEPAVNGVFPGGVGFEIGDVD